MARLISRRSWVLVLVALGAIGVSAALTGTAAAAANTPYTRCKEILRHFTFGSPNRSMVQGTACLLLVDRIKNGVPSMHDNAQLDASSGSHARASVAAPFWDLNNGIVSHLDPGTPVPGDPTQLQNLANQQIDARIRGAGYCAGGASYADAEITYSGNGSVGASPYSAFKFWLNDPPHRATLLDPQWKDVGFSVVSGSAFPGVPGFARTLVVDFGRCTP